VPLVRADVSEERIASIIMVIRIGELETTLAVTSTLLVVNCETLYFAPDVYTANNNNDKMIGVLGCICRRQCATEIDATNSAAQ
jgi:hypothetical protein